MTHDETAQIIVYGVVSGLAAGVLCLALLGPQILVERFDAQIDRILHWLDRRIQRACDFFQDGWCDQTLNFEADDELSARRGRVVGGTDQ